MNKAYLEKHSGEIEVDIFCCTEQEASGNEKSNKTEVEMDEMWSYYHDKKHQAWLWWISKTVQGISVDKSQSKR